MEPSYEKYETLREKLGLTNAIVAEQTQIPPSTFTEWKSGRSLPKTGKLYKIATYFNCSIEDLLGKED